MTCIYTLRKGFTADEEKLKAISGVRKVKTGDGRVRVEGDFRTDEVEALLDTDESYSRMTFSVEIDCAECARKVEDALKKDRANTDVSFSYAKGKLTLMTKNSRERIMEEAREAEDEIVFLDDGMKTYSFSVSIDCAECAAKVERVLLALPGVEKADFNYPKGRLTVTAKLGEDEIIRACRKAEDEIVFLDRKERTYVFNVRIDCAECARKVEDALKKNENVSSAEFNYPKGKLTVTGTLTPDEIMKAARNAEDEIIFISERKNYVFSVSIDCADCARKVEDALRKDSRIEKARFDYPKGKLYVTTALSEEDVRKICLEVEPDMSFHSAREEEKKDYSPYRIMLSLLFFLVSKIPAIPHGEYIAIIAYLIAGYDVLLKALRNILKGKVFDENFLMSIATLAAVFISSYDEAAAVMIFYQTGEFFQRKAVGTSRESIGKLMDLSVETVTAKRNGEWVSVRPEEITEGDLILLKSGEKLAVDATVEDGSSFVDTRALTGESVPVKAEKGSLVLSGSVNGESTLILRAEKEYSESTASKIMKLVEDSEGRKAESEKFITKFSRYYTPSVCIAALIVAVLPPLLGLRSFTDSIYRAAMLLVISCPCALVLSVPLTYFASMGSFARHGILVKGDEAIQNLADAAVCALDKTGTLTEGVFTVQKIEHLNCTKEHLMDTVYALEKESTHPIARALLNYTGERKAAAESVHTINGAGIEGRMDGKHIMAGSARIMKNAPRVSEEGTLVYVTEDDVLIGVLVIADRIRDTSFSTIRSLRNAGVKKIVMLSGDRSEIARRTAEKIGLDDAYGELLPQDKLEKIEELSGKEGKLLYVGDGINDAPSLKAADVGVAMGGVGSDSAIESADCVIMNDDLSRLPVAIRIARKTERITRENIILSLLVKAIVFILALFGVANMWLAVIADTGVCLLAVANAMRAMKYKE